MDMDRKKYSESTLCLKKTLFLWKKNNVANFFPAAPAKPKTIFWLRKNHSPLPHLKLNGWFPFFPKSEYNTLGRGGLNFIPVFARFLILKTKFHYWNHKSVFTVFKWWTCRNTFLIIFPTLNVSALVDHMSLWGHLSPSSISVGRGWYEIRVLRLDSVDSHFKDHIKILCYQFKKY